MDQLLKNETTAEVKNQAMGYIAGAFGLVAGLAWNDAIKSMIEFFFPFSKSSVTIKFLYAIVITVVVVILTRYLFKPLKKDSQKT